MDRGKKRVSARKKYERLMIVNWGQVRGDERLGVKGRGRIN